MNKALIRRWKWSSQGVIKERKQFFPALVNSACKAVSCSTRIEIQRGLRGTEYGVNRWLTVSSRRAALASTGTASRNPALSESIAPEHPFWETSGLDRSSAGHGDVYNNFSKLQKPLTIVKTLVRIASKLVWRR